MESGYLNRINGQMAICFIIVHDPFITSLGISYSNKLSLGADMGLLQTFLHCCQLNGGGFCSLVYHPELVIMSLLPLGFQTQAVYQEIRNKYLITGFVSIFSLIKLHLRPHSTNEAISLYYTSELQSSLAAHRFTLQDMHSDTHHCSSMFFISKSIGCTKKLPPAKWSIQDHNDLQ